MSCFRSKASPMRKRACFPGGKVVSFSPSGVTDKRARPVGVPAAFFYSGEMERGGGEKTIPQSPPVTAPFNKGALVRRDKARRRTARSPFHKGALTRRGREVNPPVTSGDSPLYTRGPWAREKKRHGRKSMPVLVMCAICGSGLPYGGGCALSGRPRGPRRRRWRRR